MNANPSKKWVWITGASSGIGEACAHAFAKTGHPVLLTARRADRLEDLAKRLSRDFGVETLPAALDVAERAHVQEFVARYGSTLSQVSVAVVNAGLARGLDPLQEGHPEDWEEMIDTNLKGALWTTESMLPFFTQKNEGHFVFMGSVAARWLYPKGNVYSATKAALHALAESLRLDLLGSRIRVTTLAPGLVQTEFSQVRFSGDLERAKTVYQGLEALAPEDIADAALWACSRPPHVNIQEIVLYPVAQASPSQVARR